MKNILLIFLLLLSISCSPRFKIGSDFDPKADFSRYVTFKKDNRNLFIRRSNMILSSELTRKRIETAIAEELTAKGYQEATDKPDFIFNFQTQTRNRQEVSQSNNYPNNWGYWSRNPMFFPQNQTTVRDYEEMTLMIDVTDTKTGQLVWQGWIIGELKYSENDWNKQLQATVKQAMAKFPAKAP
jgi:hypothetical protein